MSTPNTELLQEARESLSGRWGEAILATIVAMIIIMGSSIIPILGPLFIGGPISLGLAKYYLAFVRNESVEFSDIFSGFDDWMRSSLAYMGVALLTFLGTMAFIIPGIIIGLMLSQVMYVLADDRQIGVVDALKKSAELMKGYKTKYFMLMLIAIGLSLLCLLTLGIGFIFLLPLMYATVALFYLDIVGESRGATEGLELRQLNSPYFSPNSDDIEDLDEDFNPKDDDDMMV